MKNWLYGLDDLELFGVSLILIMTALIVGLAAVAAFCPLHNGVDRRPENSICVDSHDGAKTSLHIYPNPDGWYKTVNQAVLCKGGRIVEFKPGGWHE